VSSMLKYLRQGANDTYISTETPRMCLFGAMNINCTYLEVITFRSLELKGADHTFMKHRHRLLFLRPQFSTFNKLISKDLVHLQALWLDGEELESVHYTPITSNN